MRGIQHNDSLFKSIQFLKKSLTTICRSSSFYIELIHLKANDGNNSICFLAVKVSNSLVLFSSATALCYLAQQQPCVILLSNSSKYISFCKECNEAMTSCICSQQPFPATVPPAAVKGAVVALGFCASVTAAEGGGDCSSLIAQFP